MVNKHFQLIWLRGIGALKADSQNAYLGSLWWLLEPLLMSGLMYVAFSNGIRGSNESGASFFLFLIVGLIPLKWTQSCLQTGSNTLLNNKGFIGQVYIPKWIFPSSVALSQTIRFLFSLTILSFFLYYSGIPLVDISLSSLFLIISVHFILNLGVSTWFAASVPLIPDLTYIVPLISTTLMFTSGVFFDISTKPESIQNILMINPMVEILAAYREILLQQGDINFRDINYSASLAMVTILIGFFQINLLSKYYPRILP